jgi:error-prone DNA polymerase
LVKGLSKSGADQIIDARTNALFQSVADLRRRTNINQKDLEALSAADALATLSGHRHKTHWAIMALKDSRPLLVDEHRQQENDMDAITAPSITENVIFDYQSTGLTLRAHPLALLRRQPPFDRCRRQTDLIAMGNRRFVRTAGLVTCRQRPGTASGVIFLTLEDETGNINVIVWPRVQEQFKAALMTAQLLLIKGTVESRDGVTHVIASGLYDHSHALSDLAVKSRDFH